MPKELKHIWNVRLKEAVKALKKKDEWLNNDVIAQELGYGDGARVSENINAAKINTVFVKSFCCRYGISEDYILGKSDEMFLPAIQNNSPSVNGFHKPGQVPKVESMANQEEYQEIELHKFYTTQASDQLAKEPMAAILGKLMYEIDQLKKGK